jgi:solute carrier family 25 S-adenosylmethionine transporter 26
VRVPTEVVKQRRQAGLGSQGTAILRDILRTEGPGGLYRGYCTTLAREIPFSLIQVPHSTSLSPSPSLTPSLSLQFPLWEFLKKQLAEATGQATPPPWQGSVCGAVAGGFSAAVTTPLDVAKTRIMLAPAGSPEAALGTLATLRLVAAERGLNGLFAGVTPRVIWISIGRHTHHTPT